MSALVRYISPLLLLMPASGCRHESVPPPPDVLFIVVDDLNDWVGCLGGRAGVHTPNLDSLAAGAMLFTNAHCTAPSCAPSRTSVLTGVSPATSGVYSNHHDWRESSMLDTVTTLPAFFREAGYEVKGGGKIFHALTWIQTAYGLDQNDPELWDTYYPSKTRSMPVEKWPPGYRSDSLGTISWPAVTGAETSNRPPNFFDWGPLESSEEYADHKVVDWAIGELQKRSRKPQFLAVGLFRPHIPWFAPQEFFDLYPIDSIELPKIKKDDLRDVSKVALPWLRRDWHNWIIENGFWKEAVQAYLASISYSDYQLGRLLDALRESGRMENTIIVLWSDHGMHLGEKEQWEKFTLWEESTRVPLIIRVPGMKPGSCKEAVSLLDIYPTLAELTGGILPSHLEGVSLVPLIVCPTLTRNEPAITTFHEGNHAVRTERWRYIRYNNGDEELYDHRNDPNEFLNLARDAQYRKILEELGGWLR